MTHFRDDWLAAQALDIAPYAAALRDFAATGDWVEPMASSDPEA